MKTRRNNMINRTKYVLIILFLGLCFSSCTPRVEEVFLEIRHKYSVFPDDNVQFNLVCNKGLKDLFKGRESFLSVKKDNYRFNLTKIDSIYTEKDIKITKYGEYYSIQPKFARITIKKVTHNSIALNLYIKDSLISKDLNNVYILTQIDQHTNYVAYKTAK